MKRSKSATYRCGHAGADGVCCDEIGYFSYGNRDEGIELERRYGRGKWRCTRHRDPEEVLTPERPAREVSFTLGPSATAPGLYWHPSHGGMVSGFAYGPGWKAFAADWPAGTKIVVRVEAVRP